MIRKNPNGTYTSRLRGFPQRTFDFRKHAQEYEDKCREDRRRGKAGLPIAKGPIKYDALAQLYLDQLSTKSKAWRERMLKYSRDEFGTAYVHAMSGDEIGKWLHGLKLSNATKNHILGSLRAVLNAGVEWGYIRQSPARRSAVRPAKRGRIDPIQPFEDWSEVERVAEAAGQKWGRVIRFACATGLRPGEWKDLRWNDLDLASRTARVRGTKTENSDRTIYLSNQAMRVLRELPTPIDRTTRVFPGRYKGKPINVDAWRAKVWRPALAAAGFEYRPLYQMRHTFATLALQAGATIEDVSKMMGHASPTITYRFYSKFTQRMQDRARALLDTIGEESAQKTHTSESETQ